MAGNNIKGITIEINGETGPLQNALKDVNSKSRDLQKELREVEKGLKLDPTNTVLLEQKQKLLAESITNTKEKLGTLKTAEEQAQQKFAEGKISEEQYRALQREVISTEAELRNLETRARESNAAIDKVSEAATKLGSAGDKMQKVGKGLSIGLTAPIVAFGAAGIAAFNSVDEAMDTVITKTGATGEAARGLTDSFEEVAGRVPDDLATVGEAIGEVNTQFGFLGKELEDNSQSMLQFASINGTDVTSSSIAAKQAIEAYGLANTDLNSILDAVTKTAQDTGQSVDFLFEKATSGAPQIKALGLTFAEGAALIGNFEKAGVDSSASLSSLAKAQVAFAKDGKTMTQGLDETIKSILGAKSETEALTIAAEIFGTKGATRMVDAIKRGTFNLKDFEDAGKNAAGTVKNTFNETIDPIDQAAIAANAAKLAMAKVGDAVQVALLPVLEKATELLRKLSDWFKSLSPEMTNNIMVIAGLVASIGPLLIIFGKISTAIGAALTLFGTISGAIGIMTGATVVATPAMTALAGVFTFITGPIGIVIAIIAALVIGFLYLWNHCEAFRTFWINLWEGIKTTTKIVVDAIIEFFTVIIPSAFDSFINIVTALPGQISTFFTQIPTIVGDAITTAFNTVIKWGTDLISWVAETLPKVINNILTFFNELPGKLGTALGVAIGTVIKFGIELVNWVTINIPIIIGNIITFFSELPGKIATVFKNVLDKIISWGSDVVNWIVINIPKILGRIITFYAELPFKIASVFKDVLDKIIDWGKNIISWAVNTIPGIVTNIVGFFLDLPVKMLDIGVNIVKGIWDGIKNTTGWLMNKVSEFADGIVTGIKNTLGIKSPSRVMAEVGGYTVEGLAKGIENSKHLVSSAMDSLGTDMSVRINPTMMGFNKISQSQNDTSENIRSNNGPSQVTQNFYSPVALSPSETARQNKRALQELAFVF